MIAAPTCTLIVGKEKERERGGALADLSRVWCVFVQWGRRRRRPAAAASCGEPPYVYVCILYEYERSILSLGHGLAASRCALCIVCGEVAFRTRNNTTGKGTAHAHAVCCVRKNKRTLV